MPLRIVRSLLLVGLPLAALLLAVAACSTTIIDPATVQAPFAFEVSNPGELVGPVYGMLLQPFAGQPIMVRLADASPAEAGIDAFVEAELTAAGDISGTFIAAAAVPRINEGLGGDLGPMAKGPSSWFFFFPPEACPMTSTNDLEAAIAPISALLVWDGERRDEAGYPLEDGYVSLSIWASTNVDGVETYRREAYVPVASRSAWSASSDGPCTYDRYGDTWSFDVDFTIDVGWQFIHVLTVETYDGTTWSVDEFARSLTLEEVAELGPIGEVMPRLSDLQTATTVLGRLFR